jgi:hypothetical protein
VVWERNPRKPKKGIKKAKKGVNKSKRKDEKEFRKQSISSILLTRSRF